MAHEDRYAVLYEAPDELMALSVRDLLLEAGIAAMVQPFGMPMHGGILPSFSFAAHWGNVLVFESDEERALELVGGFLGDLGLLEEAEPEEQAPEADPRGG